MPKIIEVTAFAFSELSDKAKARARQEFVEQPGYPYDNWWSFNDFIECAKCLGIEIGVRAYLTHGGKTGEEPAIYFSGFSSQGDGASFEGTYTAQADAVKLIKAYAPTDEKLHKLAEQLTTIQVASKFADGGSTISAVIACRPYGRHVHSCTMSCKVSWTADDGTEHEDCIDEEDELIKIFRAFADWMYCELEKQYDWYFSDECVDERLAELTFDEDGDII